MTVDNEAHTSETTSQSFRRSAKQIAWVLFAALFIFSFGYLVSVLEQAPTAPGPTTLTIPMKSESDYRAATQQPDAHGAMVELACFLYRNKDSDPAEARRLLERAAALNNLEAMVHLAKFLHSGTGGPAEPALAETLLREAYSALKAGQYYAPSRDTISGPWVFVENAERDPSPDPWYALQKWLTDDAYCGQTQLSWALELGIDPQTELAPYRAHDNLPPPPPKFDKPPPPFVAPPTFPPSADPPGFRKLPYSEPGQ